MNATEQKATILFAATIIVVAITVGAMLVSGYHAGVLDNRIEWLFWAGAILAAAGVGSLGVATISRARAALTRAGVILFLLGPVLCVFAVFADYWI